MDIKFINLLFFRNYIIAFFLLYDFYTIILAKNPGNWEEFYGDKRMFTWYSGIYYFNRKKLINFIFFLILSKIILLLQIIIGLDLFIVSFFYKKIKYYDNFIYLCFFIVPWIYINLGKLKFKKMEIKKNDYRTCVFNFFFINLWLTGRIVIKNSLEFTKEWENWKKHTIYPHFKLFEFLKLVRKYKFNELNEKYSKYFTY